MIVPDNLFRNMLLLLTQQTKKKSPQNHILTQFNPKPMPSLRTATTKHWGKVDKAALHELVREGIVDIEDISYLNIDAVQAEYFPHRTVRNFRRNFKDFSGAFDLEEGLIGARRGNTCLYFIH